MNSRIYIKEKAKQSLNFNYWRNVGLFFVLLIIGVLGGGITAKFTKVNPNELRNLLMSPSGYLYALRILLFSFLSIFSIATIYSAFVLNPLKCGTHKYSSELYRGHNPEFSLPFTNAFGENYLRKVGGMLWMKLFIWLWSLLFVIPGIIKGFSYAATPYILARFPNVTATDALKLSMRIMDGKKMDLFVLGLSFIGWQLLNGLTWGILGIFFVNPYFNIAYTGFFEEAIMADLNSGRINLGELGEAL